MFGLIDWLMYGRLSAVEQMMLQELEHRVRSHRSLTDAVGLDPWEKVSRYEAFERMKALRRRGFLTLTPVFGPFVGTRGYEVEITPKGRAALRYYFFSAHQTQLRDAEAV